MIAYPVHKDSTQDLMDVAYELNIPNEVIKNVKQFGTTLMFNVNGAEYSASYTRTGKIKKNSVRIA